MIYLISEFVGKFSGGAVVALDVVEALAQSRVSIDVICQDRKITGEREEAVSDVTFLKLPFAPDKNKYPAGFLGGVRFLLKKLESELRHRFIQARFKKHPPDLLLFNDYVPSTNHMFKRYRNQYKTAHIVHLSPEYIKKYENRISLDEILDIFKATDTLIFVSDLCRDQWLSYGELNEKKSYYIPNCADENLAGGLLKKGKNDVRIKLNMLSDRFYLISAGSIEPRKGQDLLIEAAPALKKIAPGLEILIVGGDHGKFASQLKKRVQENGLDYVRFTGRRENAMEYIYASDMLVLASRAEALPLVILEAMLLKTPVIASAIDGVPEMILDRRTGRLFESDSKEGLISAFRDTYENSVNRKSYVDRASERYRNNFSALQFKTKYLMVFDELV